jgi:excisionase family DNA binding protein
MPTILTTAQAAEYLRLSPRNVRWLIATGVLPAQRVGRDWAILASDLGRARGRRLPGRPKGKAPKGKIQKKKAASAQP